jgi:replication factor A1
VDIVKKGATIEVHNGRTEVFKEYMRLAVDKWGKIVPSSTPVASVNLENNLSNVAYEKVMPTE